MNNKLRKQILKELNSLLNEEEVDYSGAKAGGSFGSGGIGRAVGTTVAGVGAAGVAGSVGLAAAGAGAVLSFPIVAVGALAFGAAYLAFRTAGWKEVAEDISDADFVSDDEVAAKLTTKKYLDLTAMKDATDESDMKSFMAAMKGLAEAYKDTRNLEEYQDFIQQAQANKGTLDKVCDNFVLLNEFGLDDKMYYVKCAKLRAFSTPPGLQVPAVSAPTAATPAAQQESKRRRLPEAIEAAPAGTTPAPVGAVKCNEIPGIKIPVSLFAVALESEIENNPRVRPPEGELPLIVCPYIEQICTGIVPEPGPSPTPGPVPAGACKRCVSTQEGCKGTNVKEIQDKLVALKLMTANDAEITSQTFGPDTKAAVQKFQTSKKLKVDGVVGPATCRGLGISGTAGVKEEPRILAIIKTMPEAEKLYKSDKNFRDAVIAAVQSSPNTGIDQSIKTAYQRYTGKPLQESKNYYDNKKLNEAKKLFNKLMKNL